MSVILGIVDFGDSRLCVNHVRCTWRSGLGFYLGVAPGSHLFAEGKTASEAWRHGVQHVQSPRCFADDYVFYEPSISGHELCSIACVRAQEISSLELRHQDACLPPNGA